jgi:integrase
MRNFQGADHATGGHLYPNTLARQFARTIAAAGVLKIRFHDLRHTSATMLLATAVHSKIVRERCAHATIAMTMYRSSHVTSDMQRQAVEALQSAIVGALKRAM